ncbi:hypothetical protein [Mesorhizobium dulcispinae]|uniref:hypothetical protein n=1 Tax=Mesorhizobium dulcispinae TaxID=3072316 RepID=UPI002A24CD78|nr:hypothetical protein [Mesorhizobium sp. VK23D]MDX8521128.1 hypothetical protein [Mesorhizobium sp. VK23D]
MRKFLCILSLIATTPALAQSAPIEPDAVISDQISRSILEPAVNMVRLHGWRCDSISALRPFLMSRGFAVVCNGFNYTYNFEDKGGNWIVSVE